MSTSQSITTARLTRMFLRYHRNYPWLNRFTCRRRGAAFHDVRTTRPILTGLRLARIMSTVRAPA